MARKKANKTAKGSKGDNSIPAEVGKPTPRPGGRNPQVANNVGDLNRHGGRTTKVDLERGVFPNSDDGHKYLSNADKEMVVVDVPYHIMYNNKPFAPGHHKVPMHVALQIKNMVYKKAKADQNIFIGKNKQFRKGEGRANIVIEHKDL